jgi:hypothetical protein
MVHGVLIDGYAPDTFVNIEYDSDLWTKLIGADGQGAWAKSNDLSATVTLRLMPGSLSNAWLQSRLSADMALNVGFGPISITDPSTLTSHNGLSSRIMKPPTKVYAGTVEALEWQIGVLELIPVHGAAPAFA